MTSEDRQYDWWRDPERLAALTDDSRRENIARYATGTAGHSKCVVPEELVDELRLTEIYTDEGIRRPRIAVR